MTRPKNSPRRKKILGLALLLLMASLPTLGGRAEAYETCVNGNAMTSCEPFPRETDLRPSVARLPRISLTRQGTLLLQPVNRGTGPGIFLPFTYVRHRDPHATIVIFPSGQFIHPDDVFSTVVSTAVAFARRNPERVILLGAPPTSLETDYGYILLAPLSAPHAAPTPKPIRRFVEKPTGEQLQDVAGSGGPWNTRIMIGGADTLWQLGKRWMLDVTRLFESLSPVIGTPDEGVVIEEIYRELPPRDFSSNLLERSTSRLAVMEMTGVRSSDWGRPERIADTLLSIGKRPNPRAVPR